jgi:hypothetical protein
MESGLKEPPLPPQALDLPDPRKLAHQGPFRLKKKVPKGQDSENCHILVLTWTLASTDHVAPPLPSLSLLHVESGSVVRLIDVESEGTGEADAPRVLVCIILVQYGPTGSFC